MKQPEKNVRFSLGELRAAGIAMDRAREEKISVDKRRKTCHADNVQILEAMNISTQKPRKVKQPPKPAATKKVADKPAKPKAAPKPKVESKPKAAPKPKAEPKPKAVAPKVKKTTKKTVKKTVKKTTKKAAPKSNSALELGDLDDMVPRFVQRLNDLGIETTAQLLATDISLKELAGVLKCTQKLIKAWKAQIEGKSQA